MKQLKQVSILSLFFIVFTSAINIIGPKLSKTYTCPEYNFQISYPGNWEVNDLKDLKTCRLILLSSPIDTILKKQDGVFSIKITPNIKLRTTTEIYNEEIANLKNKMKDFKILEEGEMFLEKIKCKYAIVQGKMDGTITSDIEFFFSQGKNSFEIGGLVSAETLGKHRDLFSDIAKSIKFSKK